MPITVLQSSNIRHATLLKGVRTVAVYIESSTAESNITLDLTSLYPAVAPAPKVFISSIEISDKSSTMGLTISSFDGTTATPLYTAPTTATSLSYAPPVVRAGAGTQVRYTTTGTASTPLKAVVYVELL
jgi:hypothetical protein